MWSLNPIFGYIEGFPHVASLKTRLLALQVLGTIMNELTDKSAETTDKCAKVITPTPIAHNELCIIIIVFCLFHRL